jgi:hypothetical protein
LEENHDKEMNDIWYAIDYQDRRINNLIDENKDYKERLELTERKLNVEVKDLKREINEIKGNLESVVDIVKVFQTHFEQLREKAKQQRTSQSPRFSSGVSNRS